MLNRVDRIFLQVSNAAAAARFYSDVMGLTVDRQQPGVVAMTFAHGDAELILHEDRNRSDVEIIYGVDDVRAMYAERATSGLQFVTPPAVAGKGWRATIRDPFGHHLIIADRGGPQAEDGAPGTLFGEMPEDRCTFDRDALIAVYLKVRRTADDLPYTRHFEALYTEYTRPLPEPRPTANEVWRQLLNLRKAGNLPKLGAATSKPPQIESAAREHLRNLLGDDIGKRDRLPYTERFDEIVTAFNKQFARPYTPHVIWRLVATLAK
jgi:predicted enzyme related to lactoylglutathione lyase